MGNLSFSAIARRRRRATLRGVMPRYRALKPFPDVLTYRNGRLILRRYMRAQADGENLAYFSAANAGQFVVLIRGDGLSPIERQLAEGFDVLHHPDVAIMQSLVARGYAERMD